MRAIIVKGVRAGGPAIKRAGGAPGGDSCFDGFNEQPPREAVEQKNDLLVGCGGGEADVGGVGRAPVRAKSVPAAGQDHFTDVAAGAWNGVNQAVIAFAHIRQERVGVGVIPALEVAHSGEAGREALAGDVHDVGCGQ